ncbi:MAG: (Fe-S)-binding protein [Deltaproteobacteria bacterium]|nr:(Fe-S)-binding protein [Deltaproteobacteria bacterium]
MTVHLFIPCYLDQYAPHAAQALCYLLDRLKVPWYYPDQQTCCGQFAFNAGDWPAARRLMRHFFKVFSGPEVILCPSASCVLTIRRHYAHLVETPSDAFHLKRLQPLVLEVSEWLSAHLPLPFSLAFPGRLFLHQSCAARQLGILPELKNLLSLTANLHVLEISPAYSCCGFGGLFSLKRPDLAQAIGLNYLRAVQALRPEALLSPDLGCLLHLQGLLPTLKWDVPLHSTVEFICRSMDSPGDAFLPPFSFPHP